MNRNDSSNQTGEQPASACLSIPKKTNRLFLAIIRNRE